MGKKKFISLIIDVIPIIYYHTNNKQVINKDTEVGRKRAPIYKRKQRATW
jgi:hypothetical protein